MATKSTGILSRVRRFAAAKKVLRARRFVDPRLTVEDFFRELSRLGVRYVVLRWFDILPRIEPGEDIDILVADEDLDRLDSLMTGTSRSGIPCDIYTPGGLPGTDFNGIAYYPGQLAKSILDNSVLQNGFISVPDVRHHFLSLAYHAAYHKGRSSRIPARGEEPDLRPSDHDYAGLLEALAAKAGITLRDVTLEGLDECLDSMGWRPTRDALEKLSAKNAWVRKYFFDAEEKLPAWWHGLSLYFIREEGMPYLEAIREVINNLSGFCIVDELSLSGDAKEMITKNIRGGNWGKGPYPKSGGLPAHIFILYDCHPVEPNAELRANHPGLTNGRAFALKNKIRDVANRDKGRGEHRNIVHSTDNAAQARDALAMVMPDALPEIEAKIRGLSHSFETPYPVVKTLSRNVRRAKVELVEYKGGLAVCKTFIPGREKYLEHEVLAREVGANLPEIVPILERGPNYLILEYVKDAKIEHKSLFPLFVRGKFLPLWVTKRVREIIRHYRKAGYALIDFSASSLMVDAAQNVKMIDFEFFQPGDGPSESLVGCWAWYGVPSSFKGDKPLFRAMNANPYKVYWLSRTGIPRFIAARDFPDFVYFFFQMVSGIYVLWLRVHERLKKIWRVFTSFAKRAVKKAVRVALRM